MERSHTRQLDLTRSQMTTATTPMRGASSLHDYVIKKRLAPALFGDVLLCEHKPTQELVAVKRILLSAAARKQTLVSKKKVRENVALECEIYRMVRKLGGHANVLNLRDEIESDGYLYMIFDFCANGELYDIVSNSAEGHLDVATTKRYVRQIAQGVRFIHANGYAHRDLSLENVLVTKDGDCQVCDFGLAAPASSASTETVGKMFYMAPEVLAGTSYDPVKADVWSLGVMMFIMLAGAPPVESAQQSDSRFRLISSKGVAQLIERWGLAEDFTPLAVDLISKMMVVDPSARISMDMVVQHPFLKNSATLERVASAADIELKEKQLASTSAVTVDSPTEAPETSGSFSQSVRRLFRRGSKRVMAVPSSTTQCKTASFSPPTHHDTMGFNSNLLSPTSTSCDSPRWEPSSAATAQQRLQRYSAVRVLASALFGDVLLCRDQHSRHMKAIKRVNLAAAQAQRTTRTGQHVHENVASERRVYRALHKRGGHRNLLMLQDEIECDGTLHLVFEYCARGDLYNVLTECPNGRIGEGMVRQYLLQVATGLSFLHNAGFAHRDVSLENVVVTAEDECQLCDFGLAFALDDKRYNAPRGPVGKVWYMAPEVYNGNMGYDLLAADVWSLGILACIMLTGGPLVSEPSRKDRRFCFIREHGVRALFEHWGTDSYMSSDVLDLLTRMLTLQPEKRLTMREVLAHPFFLG
ncbi:TPA: hypothetical protein N0F65_001032 [Lagenidium giganteum]|uniref:Protein kinase domain-containing protein n=1 Tax=Lagenidium giganteum TaxID=4803 RepID=A0AAV2YXU8_9STRA|nr:TPA: hypothetical protein N0F65_001032 [Lagenidium giganteum]